MWSKAQNGREWLASPLQHSKEDYKVLIPFLYTKVMNGYNPLQIYRSNFTLVPTT